MFILTSIADSVALRALEPIDMESYDMDPELAAQSYIDESFPNSELIVAFIVNVKQKSISFLKRLGTDPKPIRWCGGLFTTGKYRIVQTLERNGKEYPPAGGI